MAALVGATLFRLSAFVRCVVGSTVALVTIAAPLQLSSQELTIPDAYDELALRSSARLQVEYYYLHGDASQLAREMLARGPVDNMGRRRYAMTRWRIDWRWPVIDGVPQLAQAKCTLRLTVELPRWAPLRPPRATDRARWAEFTRYLGRHEHQHVKIAENRFPEVCQSLHVAGGDGKIYTVDEANAIAQSVLKRIRQEEELFDRHTDNGKRDGVRWP